MRAAPTDLRFRSLAVGVDGGPSSGPAVRWAAALARLHGARVHLVAAGARPRAGHPHGPGQGPSGPQRGAGHDVEVREGVLDPEAVLARWTAEAKALGLAATAEASDAGPAEAILRAARQRQADLVVLGSHGHGRSEFKAAAGVAQQVKDVAAAHVLIARAAPPPARILAATDGSGHAERAAAAAGALARGFGVPLTVVHVADRGRPDERLERRLAKLHGDRPGADYRVLAGRAADEIVQAAARLGAGLVVVGGRGSGGLTALSLGSVSDRVTVYSDSSVLVVKSLAD